MTLRPKPLILLFLVMLIVYGGYVSAMPLAQGPVVPTRRPTQTPTATAVLSSTPTNTATPEATDTPTELPTATNTPTPATPVVEAIRSLTLRGGPGSDYPIVATLEATQQLAIIGISEDGAWYQLLLPDGTPGWISSSTAIVATFGDLRTVPLALPPTNTPTEIPTNTAVFTPTETPTNAPTTGPTPSTAVIPIAVGSTVQGDISRLVFEVRYTFQGQAGDVVDIRMNNVSGDVDPLLILLGPNGQELIRNDDDPTGLNRDSFIGGFRLPVAGAYTIIATRFQQAQGVSEGSFSLTLSPGGAPPPTPQTSGPGTIAYGQTVTGTIQGAASEVRYTFSGQAGDVIDVRLTHTSGDLDPFLILLGLNGQPVMTDDDGGGATDSYIRSQTLPATGIYTIVATRYNQNAGTSQGNFTLTLTNIGSGGLPPQTTGGPIAYGQTVQGTIQGATHDVRYTFNAQQGDVIGVRMTHTSGDLDPYLILLGPNGQEVDDDDDSGGDFDAYIQGFVAPAAGPYTIIATHFGESTGTSQGNFTVTLEGSGGAQQLPGGSAITYGQTILGTVPPGANTDVRYTFQGQAGDVIEIRLNRSGGGQLDPLLILLDPNGNEIVRDDDSGGSRNAYISSRTLPAGGVYTIVATKFGTQGGDFTLTLTGTGGSGVPPTQPPVTGGGGALVPGATVTGTIGRGSAEVRYTFNAQAGDVIGVHMTTLSGDLDSLIILLDPSGQEVAQNDDDLLGKNLDSFLRDFEIPTSGAYTVIATRYEQADGDSTGDFELGLFSGSNFDRPVTGFDGLTPEDELSVGDSVSGTITQDSYAHLYSFEGTAGQTINIQMERASQNLDTFLVLLDPDGREIARNDDATTETIDAQISGIRLPANGAYTIVATRYLQYAGDSSGTYNLSITSASGSATVGVFAQEITYGSTQTGAIGDENYMYVYTFEGSAGDVVNIDMTPTSGDLFTVIFLTDNVGNIIASDYDTSAEESSIEGATLPEDGTYSIVATRYHADIGGTTGNFRLELSEG